MSIIDEANKDLEALRQKCKVTDAKIKNVQEFESEEEEEITMKVYTKAKCRNCGEIFIIDKPAEVNLSKDETIKLISSNPITKADLWTHPCNTGELGVADAVAVVIKD
jgi:hypothetical protein